MLDVVEGIYVREALEWDWDEVDEGAKVVLGDGPEVLPKKLDEEAGNVAPGGKEGGLNFCAL